STMGPRTHLLLGLLSGVFASLASVCAKLAADTSPSGGGIPYTLLCTSTLHDPALCRSDSAAQWSSDNAFEEYRKLALALRLVFLVLVFASNGAMWAVFTKALSVAPSSIQVTVVNSATNMCLTGILGKVLFEEPLSAQWWFGATFVVAGSVLLSEGQAESDKLEKAK
ncbi:hypothetical protein BDK51DRAFT_14203, partial [Blyttiomyces helicus]